MKKVLVVSTSLRNESNSDTLAIAFLRGAKEAGNETAYITLQDKEIAFCKGCNGQAHQNCDQAQQQGKNSLFHWDTSVMLAAAFSSSTCQRQRR